MDAVFFILFSAIECLAYFYISFVMFRYKIQHSLFQVAVFSVLVAAMSYFVRADSELGPTLVPFLSLFVLIILTYVLLRERFIFTLVMAVSGYIVFMLVQTVLAIIVTMITGISFSDLGDTPAMARAMQLLTTVILFGLGHFLFRRGMGFTFTLKKMSSRWEYPVVLTIISLLWVQLAIVLFYRSLIVAMIVFLISLGAFLYYGIKKEINSVMRKD